MWCSTRCRVKASALLGLCWLVCLQALADPTLPGSRLQGETTMRYLGLGIYHAKLWTLPDFQIERPAEQPLVLELEYLRELKGSLIAERSLLEMRHVESFSETKASQWLDEMRHVFPDVKPGDHLSGQLVPGEGALFWLNGHKLGQIQDPDFSRLFFGIWLAPTTSEPEMRLALLGIKRPKTKAF